MNLECLVFLLQGFILVFSVCCERSFKLVDDLKKEIDRARGKDVWEFSSNFVIDFVAAYRSSCFRILKILLPFL